MKCWRSWGTPSVRSPTRGSIRRRAGERRGCASTTTATASRTPRASPGLARRTVSTERLSAAPVRAEGRPWRRETMNPIVFDALLVRGEGRTVRAIVDSICLELDAEDVIAIAELPAPAALIEGAAIPARVTLRGG